MSQRLTQYLWARIARRTLLLVAGMLVCVLQVGCIHYPSPRHTYEFVTRYDRMTERFEPRISLVYVPADSSLSRYRNFIVGNVAVGKSWVENPVQAQRYATYLRMLLARELRRSETYETVALDPRQPFTGPTMRLEGKVTAFDTGSGAMRFFSYFLFFLQSSGATDLQFEGRIYDTSTGQLLMEFVDRRRHLGNTPWLPNPKTFSDEFVMKHTVYETARELTAVMRRLGSEPPPE
jgi:hypothetical protein